jgi:hypothetical protein
MEALNSKTAKKVIVLRVFMAVFMRIGGLIIEGHSRSLLRDAILSSRWINSSLSGLLLK